jgi:hypothetical protein
MGNATSMLLKGVRDTMLCSELSDMSDAIAEVIHESAECSNRSAITTMQMVYCVKDGANKFLDSARAAFNSLTEDLQSQVCLPTTLASSARQAHSACSSASGKERLPCPRQSEAFHRGQQQLPHEQDIRVYTKSM